MQMTLTLPYQVTPMILATVCYSYRMRHMNTKWLKSLALIVNLSKTEFIVFHGASYNPVEYNDPLLIDNCRIFPTKT